MYSRQSLTSWAYDQLRFFWIFPHGNAFRVAAQGHIDEDAGIRADFGKEGREGVLHGSDLKKVLAARYGLYTYRGGVAKRLTGGTPPPIV